MSLPSLLTERLTVIRVTESATEDRYGDAVDEVEENTYDGRLVQVASSENTDRGDVRISDWSGMLPTGTPLDARDRVRNEAGQVFEVVGPPVRSKTPRGEHHVSFRARFVEGV